MKTMFEKLKINILLIGNINKLAYEIDVYAISMGFSIMCVKKLSQMRVLKEFYEFDVILCDSHLDYNYEGFNIELKSLKFGILAFLSEDINSIIKLENEDLNSESKLLVPKNIDKIILLLNDLFLSTYCINRAFAIA